MVVLGALRTRLRLPLLLLALEVRPGHPSAPHGQGGEAPRPQPQPAAMLAAAAPLFAPFWTPPAPPSLQPTWPEGWDQAALAQSFNAMGLTPPVSTEWIADSGVSFHTTPDAGILSSVRPPRPSCPSIMVGDGLAFLSPPWVLLLVFLMFLLLIKWFTTFFPFTSLLLTTLVILKLTLLVLL